MHELKSLVGQHEVDGRSQRATVELVEQLVGAAVFRRCMGHHAKPVGDGFEGLGLVMHAGLRPPPGTLMDERAMGWIHQADDAIVDRAIEDGRDLHHAIRRGGQRQTRQIRDRLIELLRIVKKDPHVSIFIPAGIGRNADFLRLKRGTFDQRGDMAAAAARIELPAMVRAFDPLPVKMAERQRHPAMRTDIPHGRDLALAVTADENGQSQHHLRLHLPDGQGAAGGGRVPEAE